MCGRYTLFQKGLQVEYSTTNSLELDSRYNIAPSTKIPVVISTFQGLKLVQAHWGFRVKFGEQESLLINARSETLEEKRTFKPHLKRRCLLPTTGFYEWQKNASTNTKIPYFIHLTGRSLFAFAGLYRETKEGEIETVICTINPNKVMKSIHTRMPVILSKKAEKTWLEGKTYTDACVVLQPYPALEMEAYAISRAVNSPANDTPELIRPLSKPNEVDRT